MPDIHQRSVVACRISVVTCVDFRIHGQGLQNFLPPGYWPADVRTEPGAAHAFVHNGERRAALLEDLSLVVDAHGAEILYLFSHTDCAKYGGKEAFPNADEEYKVLWKDLVEARKIIVDRFAERNLMIRIGIIRTGTSEVLHC